MSLPARCRSVQLVRIMQQPQGDTSVNCESQWGLKLLAGSFRLGVEQVRRQTQGLKCFTANIAVIKIKFVKTVLSFG